MKHHPLLPAMLLVLFAQHSLGAEPPALDKLREDLAQRYLEPEPHLALAKYYHDRGNRLQAFLLLEYARRNLFTADQFDKAFDSTFLKPEPFDNSKEAEAALLEKLAREPQSAKLAVKVADIYISRDDWPKAKEYLRRAIERKPEDFTNVLALAEVLRREGKPREAEKVVQGFLDKYPDSREAYQRRVAPLIKKDPIAAKELLAEANRKFPQEGEFLFNLGVVLQQEGKLKEAEEHFVKAAELAKDSAHVQGWTGRFFLKVRDDKAKAVEYYLSAYFHDPHFYDGEYAEQRIGLLSIEAAGAKFAQIQKEGRRPEDSLRDKDPMLVGLAVDHLGKHWDPKHIKPLLDVLGHDDEFVRAKAQRALMDNVDRSFDPQLKALLKDPDLRKRGLAAYLAVKLWGKEGVEAVRPWLPEQAQLLRYDAVSALLRHGGETGRKIALDHLRHETHPWFKRMREAIEKQE